MGEKAEDYLANIDFFLGISLTIRFIYSKQKTLFMIKNLLLISFVTLLISFKVLGQGTTQQNITFQVIPNKTIGDGNFTLVASAESNLPVTFTVLSGTGIASVSGDTVTLSNTQAGTVTIQADQAGNINFAPAPSVLRSFTVAKKSNVITFASIVTKHSVTVILH